MRRLFVRGGSFFVIILTATKVFGRYITSIFLPLNLNADYHVLYLKSLLSAAFIIPLFVFISMSIIAIRLWKKGGFCRVMSSASLWFFISLLPVMNIIPLANIMADRYLYLPVLGFCVFLSTGIMQLKRVIKYAAIIILIVFYTIITVDRNNLWRDEFTLWHKSSQSPWCSFTTHNNLGTQYNEKGYLDAALACYQKALQKAGEIGFAECSAVYYNIGNVYEKKSLPHQAVAAYKKAIQIKPHYQQAHNNLGKAYFTLGQYENALIEYSAAVEIAPDFAYAYNNLGVLYNKHRQAG